jgi:gamma-glutamyltranspeptidase / glutathione hydrolase
MSRLFRGVAFACLLLPALAWSAGPGTAAIASPHPLATRAGMEILEAGGNAFDAAVAVSAALGVVEPFASGLGGGGLWMLHVADGGRTVMIDARETAPGAAWETMYLDEAGAPIPGASQNGPFAAGIPGTPAALAHVSERYGRQPLVQTLAPAIRLAQDGFPLYERMRLGMGFKAAQLQRWPGGTVFLREGEVPPAGTMQRLPGLALVMERMVREGRDGFYAGETAAVLIREVRANGGIWTESDLAQYQVIEREPLVADFGDFRIVAPPPPSAGGVALIQALNLLHPLGVTDMAPDDRAHFVIEALRRAFRDRGYLGDPEFVDMPLDRLLDPAYAHGQRATMRPDRATPSEIFSPLHTAPGGEHTTHFSVIDADGNRVSVTQTLNGWFGSGFVVPGLDLILNNEMDDFTVKPGTPNLFELVGAGANTIAPGKRMLSSMTPAFLESPRGVAVLGTPGGGRIISMVLIAALAWVEGADAATMVALPRYHHQYLPDRVVHEAGAFTSEQAASLQARGHALEESSRLFGNMNVVTWDYDGNRVEAATDPRGRIAGWIY